MPTTAQVVVMSVMVVVAESVLVPLRMTVVSPRGTNATVSFTAEEESLREMGLTKEMMESSLIHADAKGWVSCERTAFLLLYTSPLYHYLPSLLCFITLFMSFSCFVCYKRRKLNNASIVS